MRKSTKDSRTELARQITNIEVLLLTDRTLTKKEINQLEKERARLKRRLYPNA